MATLSVEIKTAYQLEEWLRTASTGQRAVYHHGHLAADRQGKSLSARQLDRLARYAHELGEIDEIEMRPCGHIKSIKPAAHKLRLLQQRDPEGETSSRFYIAELLP